MTKAQAEKALVIALDALETLAGWTMEDRAKHTSRQIYARKKLAELRKQGLK